MLPLSAGREASSGVGAPVYTRHRPERTLLYQLVQEYYPALEAHLAAQGTVLAGYVEQEFEDYLKCGRLEHGFLRVRCDSCHAEHLVAFSCKRRGFCPSCGARRMAESAALLVDEVFPEQPVRQWVLSVPYPLRLLFASRPVIMGQVLGIVYRCIATHLIKKAGFSCTRAQTGALTLIQRFGSALNLNLHFHMLILDGVCVERPDGSLRFRWVTAPRRPRPRRNSHDVGPRHGQPHPDDHILGPVVAALGRHRKRTTPEPFYGVHEIAENHRAYFLSLRSSTISAFSPAMTTAPTPSAAARCGSEKRWL